MNYHEKKYSEETAQAIDKEVRTIIDEAYTRAKKIIEELREQVELMAKMLMEFETLDSKDIQEIVNDEWDIEKKRARLKHEDEAHKKKPEVKEKKEGVDSQIPSPEKPADEPEPPPSTLPHDLRA